MIVPQQEISEALQANLATLRDSWFDLLAALLLVVIALCSCVHALVRVLFGLCGLVLWSLALLITWLYWLRSWAVAHSANSVHTTR